MSAPGMAAGATPGIGEPERGKVLFMAKGCTICHAIPGEIPGGGSAPVLRGVASRPQIAGRIDNTPDNLWHFLENPQRMKPGTGMPRAPLTGPEIDDLVAYLQTLK